VKKFCLMCVVSMFPFQLCASLDEDLRFAYTKNMERAIAHYKNELDLCEDLVPNTFTNKRETRIFFSGCAYSLEAFLRDDNQQL
jgi:hypothetical protein